jgi:hypothetical protein
VPKKLYVLLILVGACSFAPQTADVQPDAQSGSSVPPSPTTDAGSFAICHSQLEGVVLCLDFEDATLDPIAHDSSGGGHDADTSGVSPTARGAQQAASVTSASSITVHQSSALDLSGPLTIELWIEGASTNGYQTIFQHENGFGIDFDHAPGCYVNDSQDVFAPNPLPSGWHHVACTWDGTTIRTYLDGAVVACASMHASLQAQAVPVEISEPFTGGIDDIHLYDRALIPAEIQVLAGTVTTAVDCP